MADSDHLHRLIHSMTRSEKRYFKLYASRHTRSGSTVNERLFDAVVAMPEYDRGRLAALFPDAAFMRRLPMAKRRLYEALLESLDAYHSGGSVDDRIRKQLHHVEVLHAKALYADAAKILNAARKLAMAHERHGLLLQVAEWERRFIERDNYTTTTAKELAERADGVRGVAAAWEELDQLWQLKSRAFMLLFRVGQAPGAKGQAQMTELAAHPLLAPNAVQHSMRARYLYHHVHSALAYTGNDLPSCEQHLEGCLAVLLKEERIFQDEMNLMLGVVGNLAHVRMAMGRHKEALAGFQEFRRLPLQMAKKPSPDLEVKLFVMGRSLHLAVLAGQGDFRQAMQHARDLDQGLVRYGGRISTVRRVELLLQAAHVALGAGEANIALRWCNQLLNEKGVEEHLQLHALGRMLNLMCLVELGKKNLLGYVVRNAENSLRKQRSPFVLEQVLVAHATELADARRKTDEASAWSAFIQEVRSRADAPSEARVLERLSLLAWAGAKVEGRSMAELVKEHRQAGRTRKRKRDRAA